MLSLCFCSYGPDSRLACGCPGHVHGVHRGLCLGWSISAELLFSDPLLVRKTEPIESARLFYLAFHHLKRVSILGHFILCYLVPSLLPSQAISKYLNHTTEEGRLVCILRFSRQSKELAHLQTSGKLFLGLQVKLKSCKLENLQTIRNISQNL